MLPLLALCLILFAVLSHGEAWRWVFFGLAVLVGVFLPFLAPVAWYLAWLSIRPTRHTNKRIEQLNRQAEQDKAIRKILNK